MSWIAVGVGVVSLASGFISKGKAKKDAKVALAQRVAYKTPKELLEVVNAAKGNAQDGLDPATLAYLTNQNDRAFESSRATAERLGGDANMTSSLFDQKIQNTMKIGAENHAFNLQNFSKYLSAEQTLAGSVDAEWASREGMTKDKQQAAQMDISSANAQIQTGLNAAIAGAANYATSKLYAPPKDPSDGSLAPHVAAADPSLVANNPVKATTGATIGSQPILTRDAYGNVIYS